MVSGSSYGQFICFLHLAVSDGKALSRHGGSYRRKRSKLFHSFCCGWRLGEKTVISPLRRGALANPASTITRFAPRTDRISTDDRADASA